MLGDRTRLYVDRRSSSSLRVLSYLSYKKIDIEVLEVDVVAGAHRAPPLQSVFTAGCVPVLEVGARGRCLSQSWAIISYLETLYPSPALLPTDVFAHAAMQELCAYVSSDLHAVTNLRIRRHVADKWGEAELKAWNTHWTGIGLGTLDSLVAPNAGVYAIGDSPTLADFFIWPVLRSAEKFGVSISEMKHLAHLAQSYSRLACFAGSVAISANDNPGHA